MKRSEKHEQMLQNYRKDENGRWVYIGRWYAAEQRGEWKRVWRWRYLMQIVLAAALAVGMGAVPAGPMIGRQAEHFNYVVLCYCLTLVAGVSSAWYAGKVFFSKLRLPQNESSSADWHGILSMLCAICSGALALLQTIYLISSGVPEDLAGDILLLVLSLALCAVSLLSWFWQRRLTWTVLENGEV